MPEKADIQRLNFGQTISTQCVTDAILIIYNNNKNNKETNAFSQKDNKKALFFIVMHFVIMSSKCNGPLILHLYILHSRCHKKKTSYNKDLKNTLMDSQHKSVLCEYKLGLWRVT